MTACSLVTPSDGLSGGSANAPRDDAGQGGDATAESPDARDASGDVVAPGLDASPPEAGAASLPIISLGDGHSGSRVLSTSGTVVNTYDTLAADVASGATSLTTTGRAPVPGSLVLLWQSRGSSPSPSGAPAIDLGTSPIGVWELVRVVSSSGSRATLDRPVVAPAGYSANGAQVVVVPEYTDVVITSGASVVASPWDGAKGGIVAFFATGAVQNDGAIRADAVGFRGGVGLAANQPGGCPPTLDGPTSAGLAPKGEGLTPPIAPGGRNRAGNGGGGGNCSEAGGGGGGHGGPGGAGGYASSGEMNGGLGGAALAYSLVDRAVLGGGGGAGQIDVLVRPNRGGNGGGVVLVRARAMSGGALSARGEDAVVDVDNGGSGGGAGGAILVQAREGVSCASADARGGAGSTAYDASGSPSGGAGPGGGGGGGHVLIAGASVACAATVAGGAAGHQAVRGSANGEPGLIEPAAAAGLCGSDADCSGATPHCSPRATCGS